MNFYLQTRIRWWPFFDFSDTTRKTISDLWDNEQKIARHLNWIVPDKTSKTF